MNTVDLSNIIIFLDEKGFQTVTKPNREHKTVIYEATTSGGDKVEILTNAQHTEFSVKTPNGTKQVGSFAEVLEFLKETL
jgi:hypothetical protein